MRISHFQLLAAAILFTANAGLNGAALVLVSRPSVSVWQITTWDKLTVNGKPKIRSATDGRCQVRTEEYKRLTLENVGQSALRLHRGGYYVRRSPNGWQPVFPDGLPGKSAIDCASAWSSVRLQGQRDAKSKPAPIEVAGLYAILPGGDPSETVLDFLLDASNFSGLGEKDTAEAFDERMALLVGIAGSVSEASAAKLKGLLMAGMETAIHSSEAGITRYSTIEDGLRYAGISEKAFPSDRTQAAARTQLYKRKSWLDQRVAILKALAVGKSWDAFIEKYGDFERFDNSFEDLRKLRKTAYEESAREHYAKAQDFLKKDEYGRAIEEYNAVLLKSPKDSQVRSLLEEARITDARRQRKTIRAKLDPNSPQYSQFNRSIIFATNYIKDKRLSEAALEIERAEALDPGSPEILLMKARLLQNQKQLMRALEVLDKYDRTVSEKADIDRGMDLRGNSTYELTTTLDATAKQLTKAESEGNYVEAASLASVGSQLNPQDPMFLYHAGINSAIVRKEKEAAEYLKRYLDYSQALPEEADRRANVFSILPKLSAGTSVQSIGTRDWFSGANISDSVLYCPLSLTPTVHPVDVRASKKQTTTFQWRNGLLTSIRTESTFPGDSSATVYFDYHSASGMVRRAALAELTDKDESSVVRITPEGATGNGKGTYVVLMNHPAVNPYMVQQLHGRPAATIIAGNPYFHPFVWTEIAVFLADYDASGRVRSARQVKVKQGGVPHSFDFEWQGNRLMSIVERKNAGGQGDYRRDMHYSGDRITGETIRFQGKTSKVEYKYAGDRLIEATCDSDPSIDGRSRRVLFQP